MTFSLLTQTKLCFEPFQRTRITFDRAGAAMMLCIGMTTGCAVTNESPHITSSIYTATNHSPEASFSMFPAPVKGMTQHVLQLPKQDNESDYEVEVQLGKTELADCNLKGYWGDLAQRNLEGWGYSFYEMTEYSEGMSTMVMCYEPKTTRFIPIGDAFKFKYNSRLPKVFYLPADVELTYRTWKTTQRYQTTN
ncbi:serine protease inhibitor ecotin [Shewanella intestini]|uniref:Serine protease inhibitor ecotin n=1 Tax=Shewanella intestini TaxID=2017544 RepID=A0ABS5HZI9_9GAMM|nr:MULTISPECIES: serine protease inhibitor ecotin [Shewanella]MBR9727200.1 serine protease inhibitor ecotin [Shewanella intestini]MRG36002.1 serine protease inhibitor ecotin [Shewanella sp. XMDDZSB0408]